MAARKATPMVGRKTTPLPAPPRGALLRAVPAAALLLALTACSDPSPDAVPSSAPSPAARRTTPASPTSTHTDRSRAMDIRVTLDGRPAGATLNDGPTARDLLTLLPLTLELEDFHGTERIAYPPRRLDTAGAPEPVAAEAGDIAYYAPWGNLALFHRRGPAASAELLVLGHIDTDPDRLARAERITIEAAP
ncbi:cyclophilin-like fold protein [Streptomyces sp. NPDC005574]|uniref:cyclophilin-like fold protein n=1 Tax=Streptomyces sp. NPDC005574 TaxID=3156891 RepID=UPI0033B14A29